MLLQTYWLLAALPPAVLDSAFGEILTTCAKLEVRAPSSPSTVRAATDDLRLHRPQFMINHGEAYLRPETRPGPWILMHKVSTVRVSFERRAQPCLEPVALTRLALVRCTTSRSASSLLVSRKSGVFPRFPLLIARY